MLPDISLGERYRNVEIRIAIITGFGHLLLVMEQDARIEQLFRFHHFGLRADFEAEFGHELQIFRMLFALIELRQIPIDDPRICLLQMRRDERPIGRLRIKKIRRPAWAIPNPVKKLVRRIPVQNIALLRVCQQLRFLIRALRRVQASVQLIDRIDLFLQVLDAFNTIQIDRQFFCESPLCFMEIDCNYAAVLHVAPFPAETVSMPLAQQDPGRIIQCI